MSEELLAASKERVADLLEKINGGAGEDISYDEKFEEIKTETEKLSSVTGEQPDWSGIAVTAEEILQERSKDFRVACYLGCCKMREGVDGVMDALVFLQGLTEQYWEDMYPPLRRIRARAGMLGWMSDNAGPTAIDFKLTAADHPKVQAVDALSKELDTKFREIMADHYPGMSKLRDAVRHWVRSCPKPEAPKPKDEPAAAPAQTAAAAPRPPAQVTAAPGMGDVSTPEEAQKALKPTGNMLKKIAAQLRAQKPENELSYRLHRQGAWMELNAAPPAPNEGKSLVPPPPPHVRAALETLLQSNDWLNLLNASETHSGNFILWLDPHRFASTAMSALGALFMKAKEELLLQVAILLKRCPTLPNVAFNDGTPFADGATQMWIENEVLPVMASGDGGGGGAASSALDEPLKEARDLAVKGDLGKALDVIRKAASAAPTPAERFRGKLAGAQLCLGASQWAVARSQFDGLTKEIELHHLASWDPTLCADVYAGLYQSIHALNEARKPKNPQAAAARGGAPAVPPEEAAAERAAFEMLCRLDPGEAVKLSGK